MATKVRFCVFFLVLGVLCSLFFPQVCGYHITYVAAPLVMLFYNASLGFCLWAALGCGLMLDAIELSPRLGFLGLCFVLTCRMLYPIRLYFFKDSNITLPVMTFFFSLVAKVCEVFIALFFDIPLANTDLLSLITLSITDAIFALVVFMLPTFLWHQYCLRATRRRYGDDA